MYKTYKNKVLDLVSLIMCPAITQKNIIEIEYFFTELISHNIDNF